LDQSKRTAGTNGRCAPLFVPWQALSPFLPWPLRSTPRPLVPDEGKESTFVGHFRLAFGAPFRCGLRSAIRATTSLRSTLARRKPDRSGGAFYKSLPSRKVLKPAMPVGVLFAEVEPLEAYRQGQDHADSSINSLTDGEVSSSALSISELESTLTCFSAIPTASTGRVFAYSEGLKLKQHQFSN